MSTSPEKWATKLRERLNYPSTWKERLSKKEETCEHGGVATGHDIMSRKCGDTVARRLKRIQDISMTQKNRVQKCDVCSKEHCIRFGITAKAIFYACANHAKQISDIIYPIGNQLAVIKLKELKL